MIQRLSILALAASAFAWSGTQHSTASASIASATGASVGSATFTDTPGGLLIVGSVSGLPAGIHGIHVHSVGKCEGPAFTTAAGHFNPAMKKHGFKSADGPHMGDLPNFDMPASGPAHFEFIVPGVSLKGTNAILGANGAAIVIHATLDDYMTDPAGNSGARIACGVITGM
ncbi:MAG: superoxide dismutase family protein [Gemmatimonadaceae bacterium]